MQEARELPSTDRQDDARQRDPLDVANELLGLLEGIIDTARDEPEQLVHYLLNPTTIQRIAVAQAHLEPSYRET